MKKIKGFRWTGWITAVPQKEGITSKTIAIDWFGNKIGEYETNTTRERENLSKVEK